MIRLGRLVGVLALGLATGAGAPPAAGTVTAHRAVPPAGAVGYDVGSASCLGTLPSGGSFGVIATTAGRPYHPSRCLASEYAWARDLTYRPQYYVNLADPGRRSSHWGAGGPRRCHRNVRYDVGCAYDYGYRAAATAWSYARAAGATGTGRWWLDVETDNSWGTSRAGIRANIADIRGALHYLPARRHVRAGIYTETVWWDLITGGTRDLSKVSVWGGGADSRRNARHNCRAHSITGGPAYLAQWIARGVDHDLAC